tara:strand:+ start:1116 stop:1280 length:165 start_codon:yes stop_codon:yes gene_type:complete
MILLRLFLFIGVDKEKWHPEQKAIHKDIWNPFAILHIYLMSNGFLRFGIPFFRK